jgi:hypothetical protein
MSTWERAMLLFFLQGRHIDVVARAEEPPYGGEYAPPADVSVADPPRTTANPRGTSKKAKPSSSRHKDG